MALLPQPLTPALRPWTSRGLAHLLVGEDVLSAVRADLAQVGLSQTRPPLQTPPMPPTRGVSVPGPSAQSGDARPARESAPGRPVAASERPAPVASPDRPSAPARPSAAPDRPVPAASERVVSVAPNRPPDHPVARPAERPADHPADRPVAVATPARSDVVSGVTPNAAGLSDALADPSLWPATWQERLAKTPARPRLVWTYPELALDLQGKGSKDRGAFFRTLFRDLNLPQGGTHAFWPLWLEDATLGTELAACWDDEGAGEKLPTALRERILPELAVFRAGLRLLDPDTVVILGGVAARLLGLSDLRTLQPRMHLGRRFVRLPPVERLRDDPEQPRMLTFLRILHSQSAM